MTHNTTRTDIVHSSRALYIAMDLGRDSWQLAISDGGKTIREVKVSRKDVEGGKAEFLTEVAKARVKFGLDDEAPVHALYEAGRDGFSIARWLESVGIPCLVIDPSSILVDRKAKQRKNDAIDARALLDLLVRHVTGDREVSIVAVPPAEIDDQRELGRVLRKLAQTRRSLANRVRSVLWRYGIDEGYHADLAKKFPEMRTGDGQPLGPVTRMELDTLCGQILGLDADLQRLEDERVAQLKKPVTRAQEQARDLERLIGIGPIGAWTLAHEVFSWRTFANGKKLGAYAGLAPTPFCSGQMQRDQGISKAGPRELRALMVQLAWLWIYHQPESALAKWYKERFGPTAKRSRRVGIIAVARKLLIALWKYAMTGEVPEGARLKPMSHPIDAPIQVGAKRVRRPAPRHEPTVKPARVAGPRAKQAA